MTLYMDLFLARISSDLAGAVSPTLRNHQLEYETNYGGTHTSSMKLGVTAGESGHKDHCIQAP